MPRVKPAQEELEALLYHATPQYRAAINRLAGSYLSNDPMEHQRALDSLRGLLTRTMILGDLLGRRRLLLELNRREAARTAIAPMQTMQTFAAGEPTTTPTIPHVPFEEAIDDLLTREPVLAQNYQQVQQVYERHGFALARSTDLVTTRRVQKVIADYMREGKEPPRTLDELKAAGFEDFAPSYAETVYRTNLNTAYTDGRMRQAEDPDFRAVIGAFEFVTAGDGDVRDNHAAADGLIAATDDPIWQTFAPPAGYRCRCALRAVDRDELESLGLVNKATGQIIQRRPANFSNAFPDPGWVGSGRKVYG